MESAGSRGTDNVSYRKLCFAPGKSCGLFISMERYGYIMNKDKQEKARQKKEKEKFNSVTNSVKPENQNQEHNVRQEGIGPQNQKF